MLWAHNPQVQDRFIVMVSAASEYNSRLLSVNYN
ncbi:hypothetical protein BVRB_5g108480 [Beta vulgaris subsp. vulgaris]|nr:hypothetical protein BVRB_5g108480 [Beta vulgaris subsp. vulgaris]